MLSPKLKLLLYFIGVMILLPACATTGVPAPPPPIALNVLGEISALTPGSSAGFLVDVRAPNQEYTPVERAIIDVALVGPDSERELFTGRTDANGQLQVLFDVPADLQSAEQTLVVAASSQAGSTRWQQNVQVGELYSVLISTDKPVYQPGQTIHIRTLSLNRTSLHAAQEQPVVITIHDAQNNIIQRQELVTSPYGIAATDLLLDTQAGSGDYLITAEVGADLIAQDSRTVEVKPYTLPRFEINFDSDQPFLMPGDAASGTVNARYFFGKPVADAQVQMRGFVDDVERTEIFALDGQTDANGDFAYAFETPDYFVGQLDNSTANIDLEITVIDSANHSERVDESVTVAEQPYIVEAIAESGDLRPNLENLVYFQVSTPDGRSAAVTLEVAAQNMEFAPASVQTDANGLAVVSVTPGNIIDTRITIHVADENQTAADVTLALPYDGKPGLLLRPERAEYAIGETMNADVHVTGEVQSVYLDVIKNGQSFGMAALPVVDGAAQAAVPLDGSLLGTLELNAYAVTASGQVLRDRRLVLVNPGAAQIDVQADAEVYRPGDTAALDISVTHNDGPLPSMLGISIVDESVFALGAQDPGFARTYFLLKREMLEPRYQIDGFAPFASGTSINNDAANMALFGLMGQELATAQGVTPNAAADSESNRAAVALVVLPLLGLTLVGARRYRRQMPFILSSLTICMLLWTACASPASAPAGDAAASEGAAPAAEEAAAAEAPAEQADGATTATQGAQPPRLRQFFPETLLWLPEVETDADGHAQIDVPIADSITTWRVSVIASDQSGNLGSAQVGLRVFQDFFIEPDLPRFLTVDDEIDVPVSIFNYLDEPQSIALELASADWFELRNGGQNALTVDVAANEVSVAYIPIRVVQHGDHVLEISATGSAMNDAVARPVQILPNGQAQSSVQSGKLAAGFHTFNVDVPPSALAETASVTVRFFPGIESELLQGLDGMLQEPYGCFEQTSSTTYPNVLILDYLQSSDQINPAIQMRAETFINLGYQRLLGFEVPGYRGGFSLFGNPEPQTMLTAYGLMEFGDMSQVSYVDPALIERTVEFIMAQQNGNGSWSPQGMTIESGLEWVGDGNVLSTAYVVWALAEAGYADSDAVQQAVAYLYSTIENYESSQFNSPLQSPLANQQMEQLGLDPYGLAMTANALIAVEPQERWPRICWMNCWPALPPMTAALAWQSRGQTYMGGSGDSVNTETGAMTAIALLRSGYKLEMAQRIIDHLVTQRNQYGAFGPTQTTVLTLKALLAAIELDDQNAAAEVTVTFNGGESQTVMLSPANRDVVQQVRFAAPMAGLNGLDIEVDGERSVRYQVITDYYMPWSEVAEEPSAEVGVRVDVSYDRTELQVNDLVDVTAEVALMQEGVAGTILVDLGVPPGFSPVRGDLDALVQNGQINRYELTGRQIVLYMTNVPGGQSYTFHYRLEARFPIKAQTPSSQAYDYYTPSQQGQDQPQRIVVTLRGAGQ
ncbi:MAG: alpha-2-macroglobulin family protein [Caldilineaceae bacterium]